MYGLQVIPVIDILNGVVVHAVRGRRNQYLPLQSALCNSANPLEVARAFRNLGFSRLYIADLDAILNGNTDFSTIKCIADKTGLKLMIDAGVNTIAKAKNLLDNGASQVIIGTETLSSKGFVGEAVKQFGGDRVFVSLDLKDGVVLAPRGFNGNRDPLCLLEEFEELGVSRVIVLDLARVGSAEGVNTSFLKQAIARLELEIYVGGGVRNLDDLAALKNLGVSGVLLATALHSGKISIEQLGGFEL